MKGKAKGGSTSNLTAVSEAGDPIELTAKPDIEKTIAIENEKTYHQTEGGSQLLLSDFITDVEHYREGPRINKIMCGTYISPPFTSNSTKYFLTACTSSKRSKSLSRTPDIITKYKYQKQSWKIRKEKTCSNNHHIGHFKAIFKDKFLSWLFFQRADIPEISGYSPARHRTCVDLMIMKKALCYDIKNNGKLAYLIVNSIKTIKEWEGTLSKMHNF